jgi:hypothetical protein
VKRVSDTFSAKEKRKILYVITNEKLENIGGRMERNPQKIVVPASCSV